MELVLTGRRIDAKEALRLGLVNMVAAKGTWLDEAIELAHVDRAPAAAGGEAREAGGAGGRGDAAQRRPRARAPALRADDGDRGPRRGHAGVPREAQARSSRAGEHAGTAPRALGVAGAGTMGAGIAQVACLGGFETYLHDPFPEALERGLAAVRAGSRKAPSAAAGRPRTRQPLARLHAAPALERPRALRAGDRGRPRGPRAEARAVREAVRGLPAGRRARDQHLLPAGDRDGDRRRAARERRRHALLQPGRR